MVKVYVEEKKSVMGHWYSIDGDKLIYADGDSRGDIAVKVVDTGDDIRIIKKHGNNIKLNYSEAIELLIMLSKINTSKIEFRTEEVIKTIL